MNCKFWIGLFCLLTTLGLLSEVLAEEVSAPEQPPAVAPSEPPQAPLAVAEPSLNTPTPKKEVERHPEGKNLFVWVEYSGGSYGNLTGSPTTTVNHLSSKGLRLTQDLGRGPIVLEVGAAYRETEFSLEKYHMVHVVPEKDWLCAFFGGCNPYDQRVVDATDNIKFSRLGFPIIVKEYFYLNSQARFPLYVKAGITPWFELSRTQTDTTPGNYSLQNGEDLPSNFQNYDVVVEGAIGLKYDLLKTKMRVSFEVGIEDSMISAVKNQGAVTLSLNGKAALGYAF